VINVVSKIALPGARIYVNATTNRPFNYRFPCHRERQFLTRVNLEIICHAYRISWNYIRVWLSHSQTCHFNPIERLRSKTLMKVPHAYKRLSILLHTSPDAVWRDGTGLLTSVSAISCYTNYRQDDANDRLHVACTANHDTVYIGLQGLRRLSFNNFNTY